MNIKIGERLLLMRESERLKNRSELADMLDIPDKTLWRYETGKTMPDVNFVTKILNHPRFSKYALWFVTGETAPEVGQIAPALYDPKNYESDEKGVA